MLERGGQGRQDYETETLIPVGGFFAPPFAIQGNLIGRDAGGPCGVGASDDGTMYTMTKGDVHAVACGIDNDYNGNAELINAIKSQSSGSIQGGAVAFHPQASSSQTLNPAEIAPSLDKSKVVGMQQGMSVRRLTPKECERLQGFPDNYTLVPYGFGLSKDGPRYKALGNSMAVPVMRWIGERIQMVEDNK